MNPSNLSITARAFACWLRMFPQTTNISGTFADCCERTRSHYGPRLRTHPELRAGFAKQYHDRHAFGARVKR